MYGQLSRGDHVQSLTISETEMAIPLECRLAISATHVADRSPYVVAAAL